MFYNSSNDGLYSTTKTLAAIVLGALEAQASCYAHRVQCLCSAPCLKGRLGQARLPNGAALSQVSSGAGPSS